jgi:peptidoglycan L-alanyl-D-glutamate endopeptidase CwlK
MSNFKFSKRSIKNMYGVDGELVLVFLTAIEVSPIDFGIPSLGGLRSTLEQNVLFLEKKSHADGYRTLSKHQYGEALDFYAYVDGSASWEKHHLAMVAGVILTVAKELLERGVITFELTWGGTFGSNDLDGWDMPHMEKKVKS